MWASVSFREWAPFSPLRKAWALAVDAVAAICPRSGGEELCFSDSGVDTSYSVVMRGGWARPWLGEAGRFQILARISRFVLIPLISTTGKCISQFEKTTEIFLSKSWPRGQRRDWSRPQARWAERGLEDNVGLRARVHCVLPRTCL